MTFHELKLTLAQDISEIWNHPHISAQTVMREFSSASSLSMGHVSLPCFKLAKHLERSTYELAAEISERLKTETLAVSTSGPYVNFRWRLDVLYRGVVSRVLVDKSRFGSDTSGKGTSCLFEYCSPNIARKLDFQHARSALIGNALADIHKFLGYQTRRLCFVGDWGTQAARLLAAVELWADRSKLAAPFRDPQMDLLTDLQTRFSKGLEYDDQYAERAARCQVALESQQNETVALWKLLREIGLFAMRRTLGRLAIEFDAVECESDYAGLGANGIDATVDTIRAKAGARLSEGAWIVDVEEIPTPAIIQKKDGTTLYLTRDIAAAIDRKQRFGFDRMLYVVSDQQKLHFQLLFAVLKKMGFAWADRCEHVSFSASLATPEKSGTRDGRKVFLDDLLDEARSRSLAILTQKDPAVVDRHGAAELLGRAAVVFAALSAPREAPCELDWEKILTLDDADTGPLVQYAVIKCRSLVERGKSKGPLGEAVAVPPGYEFSGEEELILLTLASFGSALHKSVDDAEPHHVTDYLIDLAKAFNRFYYRLPVIEASDPAVRDLRLKLVEATRQTLENGLGLLGVRGLKQT